MLLRTWEYGATLDGTVLFREVTAKGRVLLAVAIDNSNEAHILLGGGDAPPGAKVTIEFRQGGPTGGHWAVAEIEGVVCP